MNMQLMVLVGAMAREVREAAKTGRSGEEGQSMVGSKLGKTKSSDTLVLPKRQGAKHQTEWCRVSGWEGEEKAEETGAKYGVVTVHAPLSSLVNELSTVTIAHIC